MPSIQELIREVSSIKQSADQLNTMVGASGQELAKSSSVIASLVRGSRTGQEGVMALSVAARSVSDAAASMKALSHTCDDYLNELSK